MATVTGYPSKASTGGKGRLRSINIEVMDNGLTVYEHREPTEKEKKSGRDWPQEKHRMVFNDTEKALAHIGECLKNEGSGKKKA